MYKYIFSVLLLLVVLSGNSQTINGRLYTQFNNYYKWRGGAFDSVLLLPNVTATAGLRGGALRYNGADSSLYVWTGFQWRKIDGGGGSTPTLQQVTTQGNSTTDSIVFANNTGNYGAITYVTGGPPGGRYGVLKLFSNFATYQTELTPTILYFRNGSTYTSLSQINNPATQNNPINLPDSSGTLPLRIKLNSSFFEAANNGTIDLGTITSTPDSSIFATRFWVNSTFQPIGNYLTTGSNGSLQSLTITGTNGNGHIHLRHQSSLPNATGQSTVIYANSNGDFAYKNDGNYHTTFVTSANTADRSYTFQNKSYTVADNAEVMKYTDTVSLSNRIDAITPGVQWSGVDTTFAYQQARKGYHENVDFGGSFGTSGLTVVDGTKYTFSGLVSLQSLTDTAFGYIVQSTGTSATAQSSLWHGHAGVMQPWINIDADAIWFNARVKVPIHSLSGETFDFRIGLSAAIAAQGVLIDAATFVYDPQGSYTGSSASNNWQVATCSTSVRTWTTTNTVVSNGWTNLAIRATSTNVQYFINGNLVATHTNNISAAFLSPVSQFWKRTGTTARTSFIDFITIDKNFTTPR